MPSNISYHESLSKMGDLLSKGDNNREVKNEYLSTLLRDLGTHKKPLLFLNDLLTKTKDLLRDLEKYATVFDGEFKSTLVYFCLKNQLVYTSGLRKIYPGKNYNSIKFQIDWMLKNNILEPATEHSRARFAFTSHVTSNCAHAGFHQARKIKFFRLTADAQEFFSHLEDELRNVSEHTKEIDQLHTTLSMTHRRLKFTESQKNTRLQNALECLRRVYDKPNYEKVLKNWALEDLPRSGINLSPAQLNEMVESGLVEKPKETKKSEKKPEPKTQQTTPLDIYLRRLTPLVGSKFFESEAIKYSDQLKSNGVEITAAKLQSMAEERVRPTVQIPA